MSEQPRTLKYNIYKRPDGVFYFGSTHEGPKDQIEEKDVLADYAFDRVAKLNELRKVMKIDLIK
jgi:hypothetical protein